MTYSSFFSRAIICVVILLAASWSNAQEPIYVVGKPEDPNHLYAYDLRMENSVQIAGEITTRSYSFWDSDDGFREEVRSNAFGAGVIYPCGNGLNNCGAVNLSGNARSRSDFKAGTAGVYARGTVASSGSGTYIANATSQVRFSDIIYFKTAADAAGVNVRLSIRLDGSFSSGSAQSSSYLTLNTIFRQRGTPFNYGFQYTEGGNGDDISVVTNMNGWTREGNTFSQNVFLVGANPRMRLESDLLARTAGGTVDFYGTSAYDIGVPDGVTFTAASQAFLTGTGSTTPIPEPQTWAMFTLGLLCLIGCTRRRAVSGSPADL